MDAAVSTAPNRPEPLLYLEQGPRYLITPPKGHILINSDLEANVPMIRASIEALGYRFDDAAATPRGWPQSRLANRGADLKSLPLRRCHMQLELRRGPTSTHRHTP